MSLFMCTCVSNYNWLFFGLWSRAPHCSSLFTNHELQWCLFCGIQWLLNRYTFSLNPNWHLKKESVQNYESCKNVDCLGGLDDGLENHGTTQNLSGVTGWASVVCMLLFTSYPHGK